MREMIAFTVLLALSFAAAAPVDLQAKYPFNAVLLDGQGQYYELHWNFSRSSERIYFAVNVSTTGWVGFGLSPNGQMPNSDVVMGWVSDGESYFHDRFARGRFLPVIDTVSQDWFLTNSEEVNGYTVLEFWRNFESCDPQDLNIAGSTSRVVWSFSFTDPTSPTGDDAMFHNRQGTRSLNLIGSNPSALRETTANEPFLDFTVTNVVIPPASTTYWCEVFPTPEIFTQRQHYVNRFGPALTNHTRAYVHHIIVYECPKALPRESIGVGMPCDDFASASSCREGNVLGGWAVGGEDFTFPEGVAYPIAGATEAMIEMHYDNPDMDTGVIDNSGVRFYYTTDPPAQEAGTLSLGHGVVGSMIVPPGAQNYTITGVCPTACTQSLPSEGITVFANNFHTHLAGHGLTLQHYRWNTECNVLEELEPIEQNLQYDFNYQQTTILPKQHLVLPGDVLALRCFYATMDRDNVTTGGESTREEMCLSYLYYYPRPRTGDYLEVCQSIPREASFTHFYLTLLRMDPVAAARFTDSSQALDVLNNLDWQGNPELERALEESVTNSTNTAVCFTSTRGLFPDANPVTPGCSYQAPSRCGGPEPLTCCEQVAATQAAASIPASMGIAALLLFITIALC